MFTLVDYNMTSESSSSNCSYDSLSTKYKNYNTEINRHTVFENAMRVLGERNDELREEVLFLREESTNKSFIINNLMELTKQNMVNKVQDDANGSRRISSIHDPNCKITSLDQSNILFNEETRPRKISNIINELKSTPIKTPIKVRNNHEYTYFPQLDEEDELDLLGDDNEVNDNGKCHKEDKGITLHDASITRNPNGEDKLNNNPILQYYSFISTNPDISDQNNIMFHDEIVHKYSPDKNFAAWEKHSLGFGTKMLHKMGYQGGGLGKHENGIINPIMANKEQFRSVPRKKTVTEKRINNVVHPWQANTTLITGSSILCGLNEKRLQKYKIKVRAFPGATVDDMHDYLKPLLKKNPSNIIIHIGSNDSVHKTADEILNEIENLISFIKEILPDVKIYHSCPIIRTDNAQANAVLNKLNQLLKDKPNSILNENIDKSCLGRKGLHLNPKGSGRLAINYISLMQRL